METFGKQGPVVASAAKRVESNAKAIKNILDKPAVRDTRMWRESFKNRMGFAYNDQTKLPTLDEGFSYEKLLESAPSKLREADTLSGFVQLTRAGIQTVVDKMYETVETSWDKWVTVVQSKKREELYAPLAALSFPREVGASERYPELKAAGLDLKMRNRKYGSMYAVELELEQDDLTGQINNQAATLGEYMKLVMEVIVMGKLAGVSLGTYYGDFKSRANETKPSFEAGGWPFASSASPLYGGGINRPTSFGALTASNLQFGHTALRRQKNILGLKMNVDPDTLLVGSEISFDAQVLMNSSINAQVPGVAGTIPGTFATNTLFQKYRVVESRFMFGNNVPSDAAGFTVNGNSKAWYLLDSKKPFFVAQIREAATIINEAPNSGASFELDQMRFKARMRGNADFIDSRFVFQGNDGSI